MDGAIAQGRQSCQFRFWLMKNPLLYRPARPESGREVRKRLLVAPLARTQSERRRPLALAGSFGCSNCLEQIDSTSGGAWRCAGRRPRWLGILTITCGSSIATMIFKAPPQLGQCFTSISKTRLSSRAQLMRGVSLLGREIRDAVA